LDSQTPRFSILNQVETKVTGELQFCKSPLTPHYFSNTKPNVNLTNVDFMSRSQTSLFF